MANIDPMHRRAAWHDYHAPSMYMVTLKKADEAPRFANIVNVGSCEKMEAGVQLTAAGKCLWTQKEVWEAEFEALHVMCFIVMPDHVHMLLRVKERTDRHLSHLLGIYKLGCNRELSVRAFDDGFNDKIVFRKGQKDAFYRYITDNPRRYLARRLHREFFERTVNFEVDGTVYALYGNLFLLNAPDKTVVRYSSRHTADERRRKEGEYAEAMRTRGVLVSPFIHPEERAVRDRAVAAGCPLIKVVQNGFGARFKPSGADFDLCAEGRLLLIGPAEVTTRRVDLHRGAAMAANALAEAVAAMPVPVL